MAINPIEYLGNKKVLRRPILVVYLDAEGKKLATNTFVTPDAAVSTLSYRLVNLYKSATHAILTNRHSHHSMRFNKEGRTKVKQVPGTFFKDAKAILGAVEAITPKPLTDEELAASMKKFPFGQAGFLEPTKASVGMSENVDAGELAQGAARKIMQLLPGPLVTFTDIHMVPRQLVHVEGIPAGVIVELGPDPSREFDFGRPVGKVESIFAYLPFATDRMGTPVIGDFTTVANTTKYVAPFYKDLLKNLKGY